jgi:hypothetical protein
MSPRTATDTSPEVRPANPARGLCWPFLFPAAGEGMAAIGGLCYASFSPNATTPPPLMGSPAVLHALGGQGMCVQDDCITLCLRVAGQGTQQTSRPAAVSGWGWGASPLASRMAPRLRGRGPSRAACVWMGVEVLQCRVFASELGRLVSDSAATHGPWRVWRGIKMMKKSSNAQAHLCCPRGGCRILHLVLSSFFFFHLVPDKWHYWSYSF